MTSMSFRRTATVCATLAILAAACASPAEAPVISAEAPVSRPDLSPDGGARVMLPGRTITLEQLEGVGYKKSKQLAADALPGAQTVWYGFFNRRDIEVRVYESHTAALELGVAPAYSATQAQKRRGGGDRGAGHDSITSYNAYLVAGNLVMLCEVEVASCEALIKALP